MSEKGSIMVVDDDLTMLEILQDNLTEEGYKVYICSGPSEAIDLLKCNSVDVVITDYKMEGATGLDLIRHVKENLKDIEVIMMTGFATIDGAVKAVKTGASEYLTKPFTKESLISTVKLIFENIRLRKIGKNAECKKLKNKHDCIGESEVMRKVYSAIEKAAETTATVLITGESGTGKELVARSIHYNSSRASAPFVPVNCGGIPESLLESELFGHVKGAFTGAILSRAGFFQTADGGTIFLDEISETSLAMQVKLLRVLQEKEICMVGDNKTRKVNIRILAATNKDLPTLVKKGLFREDLYFRLNVLAINIPPLRDRGDDIALLIHHYLKKFSEESGKPLPTLSDTALQTLINYDWPGNVRELENVIQRLIVMSDGESIDMPDLPSPMRFYSISKPGLTKSLSDVEYEYINNVLASVGGNKSKASKILGIDRKTLLKKLQERQNNSEN